MLYVGALMTRPVPSVDARHGAARMTSYLSAHIEGQRRVILPQPARDLSRLDPVRRTDVARFRLLSSRRRTGSSSLMRRARSRRSGSGMAQHTRRAAPTVSGRWGWGTLRRFAEL